LLIHPSPELGERLAAKYELLNKYCKLFYDYEYGMQLRSK